VDVAEGEVAVGCEGQCRGIETEFDGKTAARDRRRYRRKGPLRHTRILLEGLRREGLDGASLLDIGGGIGAIHHELLADVATSAIHVDASAAYLKEARSEAERRGHLGRVRFVHGDFVELAPELPGTDVVTLDRVICCYPDVGRMVGLSGAMARRLYGVVYPRDTWWMKIAFALANLYFRIRRCPFRVFVHPAERVDTLIRRTGLTPAFRKRTLVWTIAVYRRTGGNDPGRWEPRADREGPRADDLRPWISSAEDHGWNPRSGP
jgi:hypothetical protein